MNCINVTQDREKWLAGMNMVLNLEFHKLWISWLAEKLLASEQGLCYMLLMCTVTK
jgi:hypothetical protein